MLPSIDEMIQKDIDREKEERLKAETENENLDSEASAIDAQLAWKAQLKAMIGNRKPIDTTIKP